MEPLSLHIGGASKIGLPLPPAQGPIISPSAGLALPDAPRDASDDEIGLDDLLGFGGADADAAKRSLAFNAGKYDEAVRSIAALGRDPVKRDGKVMARAAADDAARATRAKAVEDEFQRARNAVTRVTPQKVVGRMLGDDDDDASTASSEVSLHEDVLSDDDEAPPLLTLEELRARKTADVETLPAVRRIAAMRRKAAPDDKYSVDYSRFAAIDSSDGEDEPTRADAYRSMDFKNLPKAAPASSSRKGFTSVLDMCDELAPEPPPPDAERRDGLYFEKTNQFVPYANEFAVPHVPPDASAKLGALIDRFKPK
mmetsp:Transcript_7752/g.20578  ORF Transcript_7752/g.20578 Transcript_7752/m.20578 type:complete len:312 (-) Transcript_7752:11-946(-)